MRIFCLEVIIICLGCLTLMGCAPKTNSDKANEIRNISSQYIVNYKYNDAIEHLIQFDKENPDYETLGVGTHFFLMKCYEATGEFDNLKREIDLYETKKKTILMNQVLGFDWYRPVFQRIYVKYNSIEQALNLINTEPEATKIGLSAKLESLRMVAFRYHIDTYVDVLALGMYAEANGSKKSKDVEKMLFVDKMVNARIAKFADWLTSPNGRGEIVPVIVDLLNYRTIDDHYYTDLLWKRADFREVFKRLYKAGLIDVDMLVKIKEGSIRKPLPADFISFWNSTIAPQNR